VVRLFNGDRRQGAEKQCKIEVDLRPRTVTAQDADNDLLAAVQGAANRVSRSVGRALESERAQDEGSVSPWTSWRPGT
jgi:hypothetical protein